MVSDIDWQRQVCVCGSPGSTQLFAIADTNFGNTSQTAMLCKCEACGSLFPSLFPTQETIGLAYSRYYTHPGKGMSRFLDPLRKDYMMREAPESGRLLDYGCGSGDYLRNLDRPGLALFGHDVVKPSDTTNFEWLESIGDRTFDHITLSHVIEHVHDQRALLQTLASALSPGGRIWLSTPSADSFLLAAFGAASRDIDFPRHRIIFARHLLKRLANEAGFSIAWRRSPLVVTLLNLASCLRQARPDIRKVRLRRGSEPELVAVLTRA